MLRKMPLHVFFCSAQIQDWRISLCYFVVQKPGTTRWLAACKTLASKSAQIRTRPRHIVLATEASASLRTYSETH